MDGDFSEREDWRLWCRQDRRDEMVCLFALLPEFLCGDVCGVIFEFHNLAHAQYFRSQTKDAFIEYFKLKLSNTQLPSDFCAFLSLHTAFDGWVETRERTRSLDDASTLGDVSQHFNERFM